ncbi:MASE1 domain-containing protein [Caulobacter segnis]|uniref:MASE1 domain-containing protein n=1 Tax=Caulobacter segnis TaxID=88688 RepID=UPI001CBDBB2F|nr:MASE1 domain-containing protein [Caulobacter segnis]UAL09454.1 MASE1 domain-containing protein [Caulobacter segnis]
MPHRLAAQERRRQAALLLGLSAAVVISLAFSEYLTRTALGVAAFWPANALLAAGLITLTGSRGLSLTIVFVVFHLAIDLLVGDSPMRALLYTAVDTGEALAVWGLCQRLWRGAPRIRSMRSLALLPAVTTPVAAIVALLVAWILHLVDGEPLVRGLTDWFLRCALGMAVALPATLVLIDAEHRRSFHRPWPEQLMLLFAVFAVTLLCAHPASGAPPFLIFPIALATAYRLGARGAAMASVIVAVVTLPIAMSGASPRFNAILGPVAQARTIQVFITVLFYTSLAAGLALAQQDRLKRLLLRREQLTRAARSRALAATEAKTEFLATMSHEIRTPLNSVLGFAQLLATRQDLPPDVRRQVNLIDSAGAALLTVVNDILDFSRVETGQIELLPQPTSAAGLLRDTVAIMAPEARAKGLSMDLEIIDPVGGLHDLDADRLRQVLINLLNNAVKFTEEGRIDARLIIEPGDIEDRLRFEIIDTGVGIDLDKQSLLFQRFSQADSSVSRLHGGAGLGLAICRALVEVMGGKIGADSVPGRGSCFWVELSAPTAEPIVLPERPKTSAPGAAKVLIVDDHPVNLEIGEALLTLVGCEVDVAENGKQAVEKATGGRYDVILMDIHMPQMDGLQATRAIKALRGEAGKVPIIAMSADALPRQVERCYAAGMVDHIAKPIQREVLYAKIERWMHHRGGEAH